MASIIRIKRSSVSGNPSTLAAGELAYSALTDNGSNGGERLYIGIGSETSGNAANHLVIGGTYFTDKLDHTPGTLTASSAIIVDSSKKIDDFYVDNLQLNGSTLSTTNTNGDLSITPNGSGKTIITNPYIGDNATSLAEYIYDTVGGAVTGGTGITISNSDVGNTSTISISNTAVTAGSYGSASAIPVLTINAQGQITAATTASVASSLNIAGDTGTDAVALLTDTLTFTGGTGITSSVTNNAVTFDIDSTVTTLTGTQTLTNKTLTSPVLTTPTLGVATATSINKVTITAPTTSATLTLADGSSLATVGAYSQTFTATANTTLTLPVTGTLATLAGTETLTGKTMSGSSNTFTNIPNSALVNTSVTFGSTTVALGSTSTSLAGLTELTVDNININGNTISSTNTNGDIVISPNGTGVVDVGNSIISGVATPVSSTDAANKAYVDNAVTGLDWKAAANLLAVSNVPLTGNTNTVSIDGHATLTSVHSGYRILLKGQSTQSQNGIYDYADNGTTYTLTRSVDADTYQELVGTSVYIMEGTQYASTGWVQTNHYLVNFGETGNYQSWTQFAGSGAYTAGNGLTLSGTTFDAVGTTGRISVSSDSIDIDVNYVGQSTITTLGTVTTGTWNAGVVAGQYGGTGVANTGKTITLGGNLTTSGAYALTLTQTGSTNVTLPTTGTLATLAGTEALSNKTITSSSFSGTTIAGSGLVTFTNSTDASAVGTAAVVLSGGLSVAKAMYIGTNITGAGAATSTLDGFNIDGGTY
jgi:hypothetical protein